MNALSRLLAVILALSASAASAQGVFSQRVDYAQTHLHAGWAEGERRRAGLRMELAPGWKTYWRAPGAAGIAPRFDWTGSVNVASVEIEWPIPMVFDTYGMRTIGYEGRMVLPMMITAKDPTQPVELRLSLAYGLCKEICIPATEDLALTIAPDAAEDGAFFIQGALDARPVSVEAAGLRTAACRVEGAGKQRRLTARFTSETPVAEAPMIIAEGPEGVWVGPVSTRIEGPSIHAEAAVETEAGAWIDRSELLLTVLTPSLAAEGLCAAQG